MQTLLRGVMHTACFKLIPLVAQLRTHYDTAENSLILTIECPLKGKCTPLCGLNLCWLPQVDIWRAGAVPASDPFFRLVVASRFLGAGGPPR